MALTSRKTKTLRTLLAAGAAACVLCWGTGALAQSTPEVDARIRQLEDQVAALSTQIAELKAATAHQAQAQAQVQAQAPAQATVQAAAKPPAPKPETAVASLAGGKPLLATADGRFTFSPRLVVQLDAAAYQQGAAGPLATDLRRGSLGDASQASHARDLGDGANFRRARIGFGGKAFGDFDYSAIFDFGGAGNAGGATITEAYVQYSGVQGLRLRAGAWAPATGLEDATANTQSLFQERASIAEIVRGMAGGDGREAVAAYVNGRSWFGSLAWTGNAYGTSNNGAQSAIVARAAFAPLRGEDWVIHLGANTTYILTPADNGPDVTSGRYALRLRDRPELRVDATQVIDTGNIDARHFTSAGLELGAQWKGFYLAGEYEALSLQRRGSPLSDPRFSGWYVQGSWFPTGEQRRWNSLTGGFDGPAVVHPFNLKTGDWGALELAARYSVTDLNYHAGALGSAAGADAVRGGDQKIWSLGFDWYLNSLIKLSGQYQSIEVDRLSPGLAAFGAGALTPPAGAQVGQSLHTVGVRTQVAF